MDLEHIKQRVERIYTMRDDDESAHIEEDRLREDFIELVAEVGSPELAAMAEEVLKTAGFDFSRWCA